MEKIWLERERKQKQRLVDNYRKKIISELKSDGLDTIFNSKEKQEENTKYTLWERIMRVLGNN